MDNTLIQSDRLKITRTQEQDLDFALAAEYSPDNSQYVGQWKKEEHLHALNNPDILHILFETYPDRQKIGYAIIAGLQKPSKSIELMRLVIVDKGKGYGKEALNLIKDYCFQTLQAHRLWLDVRSNNPRAKHVYEQAGFIQEGVLRESVIYNGQYLSLIVMSILESEYTAPESSIL